MDRLVNNGQPAAPGLEQQRAVQNFFEVDLNYSTALNGLQYEIDRKFAPKKAMSQVLADVYEALSRSGYYEVPPSMAGAVDRVRDCGTWLVFAVPPTDGERARLDHANFCRDRLCPMCNWRRSLKTFSQISRVMDHLEPQGYRYVFLTLTVRNCAGDQLRDTITSMLGGWRKLSMRRGLMYGRGAPIVGAIRTLEVTYNASAQTYHPHLHVILAVRPAYFGGHGSYISQARWCQYWQEACGLDYTPVCYVETVKPRVGGDDGRDFGAAVAEISKYAVKSTDWYLRVGAERVEVVRWLHHGLSGRRLVSMSGVFGAARRQLALDDADDGDLVHTGEDNIRPDVAYCMVTYRWGGGGYSVYYTDGGCTGDG